FVDRASLLRFLEDMIAAETVEAGMQARQLEADPPPKPKPLRVALPGDLRSVMLRDLPENIQISRGRLEITAPDATSMLESLWVLAQALTNDLDSAQRLLDPTPPAAQSGDDDLRALLAELRRGATS
ncbi:MAG: hypothetical protein ACRYGF_04905, partial [Janthinobacterium lividum]